MALLRNLVLLASAVGTVYAYVSSGQILSRTVVTTDVESDDFAALVRYLLYTNDLDTQGIVYTASRYHWAGDGRGTKFFLPGREYNTSQTSWRWTGDTTIQDVYWKAYAEVYSNLRVHDPYYPTPEYLLSIVKLGNIDFEGEMDHDTAGSDLIRDLLLDDDPRPLYLQAWGGTNTIARALKSIEEVYGDCSEWTDLYTKVSTKAVILASGFQDETYANYIAPQWPHLRVEDLSAAYATWGYNCNRGKGNTRGLPGAHEYYTGAWIKANIEIGPLGKHYRSWLDGQTTMPGDPLDGFGNLNTTSVDAWCPHLGPYDFLSEGDIVTFTPLLVSGIQNPADPALGGWGGRSFQNSTIPDLWQLVKEERNETGSNEVNTTSTQSYSTDRWAAAMQNDFASRMSWTVISDYSAADHPPAVTILNGESVVVCAGEEVKLMGQVIDPDLGSTTSASWWQYLEEGTYPGQVQVSSSHNGLQAVVVVPNDAQSGQTISIIFQGTGSGRYPLTRYGRVVLTVE